MVTAPGTLRATARCIPDSEVLKFKSRIYICRVARRLSGTDLGGLWK
jgi:hypothetical protein